MLRLLASLARRLMSGAAALGRYGILGSASVVDTFLASVAEAWSRRHQSDDEIDVDAVVDQRVASVVEQIVAAEKGRRAAIPAPAREPADLPVPKHMPPSRAALPDIVDPRREPERYACLQALRFTTRVMFGAGAAPMPDLSILNATQVARLHRLTTPAQAAPIHRDMVRRLGWEGVDGWWWPHRVQPKPTVAFERTGTGGGPAFRRG